MSLARVYQLNSPKYKHNCGTNPVRIVCVSDTHNAHESLPALPDGDVLIHAGDLTQSGTIEELHSTLTWMSKQPHRHKIFIAGNHDTSLDDPTSLSSIMDSFPDLTYLQGSSISLVINGRTFNVYGSPMTPIHGSWRFQYPRTKDTSSTQWSSIPRDTDILITHGPPAHHLDDGNGCITLLAAIWRVRPALHVFGHIHAARGVETVAWTRAQAFYEDVMSGKRGIRVLISSIWTLFARLWTWRILAKMTKHTVMVNAASVGGFRDELRNSAIVVEL